MAYRVQITRFGVASDGYLSGQVATPCAGIVRLASRRRGRLTIAVLRRLANPLVVPGRCAVRLARPAQRSP